MTSRAMFSPPWKVFSYLELNKNCNNQAQGMRLILNNIEILQNIHSGETPENCYVKPAVM